MVRVIEFRWHDEEVFKVAYRADERPDEEQLAEARALEAERRERHPDHPHCEDFRMGEREKPSPAVHLLPSQYVAIAERIAERSDA